MVESHPDLIELARADGGWFLTETIVVWPIRSDHSSKSHYRQVRPAGLSEVSQSTVSREVNVPNANPFDAELLRIDTSLPDLASFAVDHY